MKVTCTLCQLRCIPLADFDEPTCIRCEDTRAAILAASERPIIPSPVSRLRDRLPERPILSYFGPAPKAVIDELVDALFPQYVDRIRESRHHRQESA